MWTEKSRKESPLLKKKDIMMDSGLLLMNILISGYYAIYIGNNFLWLKRAFLWLKRALKVEKLFFAKIFKRKNHNKNFKRKDLSNNIWIHLFSYYYMKRFVVATNRIK